MIREVTQPDCWAPAPVEMSVTALTDIEACPRRWALASAEYRSVWSRKGYPTRPNVGALAGTVIHLALQTITQRLVKAGCSTVTEPSAIAAIRNLGGFTKIVADAIARVLERLRDNPRATLLLEEAGNSLRNQSGRIRADVQSLLGRIRLGPVRSPSSGGGEGSSALGYGSYSEVALCARDLRWRGVVDLLTLSPESCDILDFKSGAHSDAHTFQVHAYAVIWYRDGERNPGKRRATSLTLSYAQGDVHVAAPTAEELAIIENELIQRARAARDAVAKAPPDARVAPENCSYCHVRHLCEEYWSTRAATLEASERGEFGDAELTLTKPHGPLSWDALEIRKASERPALLRLPIARDDVSIGDRVRILGAFVTRPSDENTPTIVTVGGGSEVFTVR